MRNQQAKFQFKSFPSLIISEEFLLRELKENDLDSLNSMYQDNELLKYTDELTHRSLEDTKQYLEKASYLFNNKRSILWGVAERATDNLVGITRIKNIDLKNKACVLGYYLTPNSWGKGIATKVVDVICNFVFYEINLHRIEAQVYIAHNASIKVLEKNNFQREGRLRENFLIDGEFRDSWLYAKLNTD